jgi:hypothetical protein
MIIEKSTGEKLTRNWRNDGKAANSLCSFVSLTFFLSFNNFGEENGILKSEENENTEP